MNWNDTNNADEKLRVLLRRARPLAELPIGFEGRVWQRIEGLEEERIGMLELLSRWLLTPRIAAGALACLVVMAAALGVARGVQVGDQAARERYLATVDPAHFQR